MNNGLLELGNSDRPYGVLTSHNPSTCRYSLCAVVETAAADVVAAGRAAAASAAAGKAAAASDLAAAWDAAEQLELVQKLPDAPSPSLRVPLIPASQQW